MAKKIMSKSKRDDNNSTTTCYRQNGGHQKQDGRRAGGMPSRTFNRSENDLSLNYNSVPRQWSSGQVSEAAAYSPRTAAAGGRFEARNGIRYAPNGRQSPEVEMYKTRVVYHSRQDCSDQHSSV